MRALLLCAGYGKRLHPITKYIPKCLVEINKTTMIEIWLKKLVELGITDVLINTHYMAEKVEKHVNSLNFPLNIKLVYEEKLLGTAGTLKKNKCFFKNQPLMLIHTDNLSLFDSNAFINKFKSRTKNIDMGEII